MRQWVTVLVLFVGLHALMGPSAPLAAQQEQGDVELQLTGSVLSTVGQDGASVTSGIIKTKAGYFFTDRIEFGVFPSLVFTRTTLDEGDWDGVGSRTVSDTRFGLGAFGTYSFLAADAMTVPYLGVQFYRIDVTDDDETGWAGVNGGVKFYMSRNLAFDMGGNLLMGLGDSGGALILFQFGLSFLL